VRNVGRRQVELVARVLLGPVREQGLAGFELAALRRPVQCRHAKRISCIDTGASPQEQLDRRSAAYARRMHERRGAVVVAQIHTSLRITMRLRAVEERLNERLRL